MAVVVRKPKISKPKKSESRPRLLSRCHYPEAPDRGDSVREAPEARCDRRFAEAPDAGLGRAGSYESEFTHGRSRS
jgi:hypothetical protein